MRWIFLSLGILLIAGCFAMDTGAKGTGFIVDYDDIDKVTTYYVEGFNDMLNRESGYSGSLSLSPWGCELRDEVSLYILLRYKDDSWLFIKQENSLTLIVDGERYDLSAEWGINRDVSGGGIVESGSYLVSFDLIKKIAAAVEVKVRIYGDHPKDFSFTPYLFNEFKAFVEGYESVLTGASEETKEEKR